MISTDTNEPSDDAIQAGDGDPTADADAATDAATDDSGRSGRRWVVGGLVVVATIIAVVSALNTWVERQVLDTDGWETLSDDLLQDDEVRAALSTFLVDELYRNADVSGELETQLPEQLQGLAGPISAALRDPVTNTVDRLLGTEPVLNTWKAVNRTAHEAFSRALRDETRPGLSTADGTVTLDLGEVVQTLGEQLGLSGNRLDRLPDDAGQITVFESNQLDAAQRYVKIIDALSNFLFVLVIAMYALAVYLAQGHRRETVRNVGWAVAFGGLVVLVARRISIRVAVESLADTPDQRGPVDAVAVIGTDLLRSMGWAGIAYGIVVVLYAALAGPSNWATSIRRAIAPLLTANRYAVWTATAAVLLLYVAWQPGAAVESWATGLVFLILFVAAVEALRQQVSREFPNASLNDFGAAWRATFGSLGRDSSPPTTIDVTEIESLHRLHQEGALTDEEYASAKKSTLAQG
ncbi:MAG: SHOCT domain-containing protein [Acidimicrobiia bacterium]|nr:SHOCT domain-containing protein [Acidimicrobiia bacterium]